MNIWQDNNKVSTDLQAELANYKVLRDTAKEETSDLTGVKFFGLSENHNEYKLKITDDLSKIDDEDRMQLAVVIPDNESFDILESKDYTDKLKLKDKNKLRRFMVNLLDSLP